MVGRRRTAIEVGVGLGAAMLVALALWWPVLHAPFVGDDFEAIGGIRSGPTWAWLHDLTIGGHLRPVLSLTLWLDWSGSSTDPLGYRLTAVLLHALVTGAVGWLAAELVAATGPWAARTARALPWLAAASFLVAPLHTEPVAWIAARGDLLAALAGLVAVAAWVRGRRRGRRWDLVSAAAFAVALGSKEPAVVVPVLLVAFEAWLPDPAVADRRWRTVARRLVPHAVVGALYVAAWWPHRDVLRGEATYSTDDGPVLVARRWAQVVLRAAAPPLDPIGRWVVVGLVVAAVTAVVVGRRRGAPALAPRRWRTAGFLATAAVLAAAPVARFGVSVTTVAGERFSYLPSAFVAIAVGGLLAAVVARAGRWGTVAVVAVLALGAGATAVHTRAWADAAATNDRILAEAGTWPPGETVVVLAAPDTLDGVWVGRSAYGAALALLHGWAPEQVPALAQLVAVAMASADDGVTVRPGPCDGCVTVEPDGEGASFVLTEGDLPGGRATPAGTRVVEASEDRLVVWLAPEDRDRVWYLRDGRLVRWTG